MLKSKLAKTALRTFNEDVFPVNVRDRESAKFRFGMVECSRKGLVEPYPVTKVSSSEYVARVKFTVIVKDKPILITGRSSKEQLKKIKLDK